MSNFDQAVGRLDLGLFDKIASQSSDDDKQSLLACQLAVRGLRPEYRYLEIGSYLGGSIQPHLLDERCAKIYSIDKRPERQPDARGVDYTYLNNSTERMLENLKGVSPEGVAKIETIDGSTSQIDPSRIADPIDLCFIDGEHTDAAVLADFKFCLEVLADDGAILFHDATVTYNGIRNCLEHLELAGKKFRAYSLPSIVFVIEIGDFPLHRNEQILERLTNNYNSYIYSLQYNDYYRQFANKAPFRLYRKFVTKWKGLNKFD